MYRLATPVPTHAQPPHRGQHPHGVRGVERQDELTQTCHCLPESTVSVLWVWTVV